MKTIPFSILLPDRKVLGEEVSFLVVPAEDGELGILPGHAELIAPIVPGTVRYQMEGEEKRLSVERGFVHVSPGGVELFVAALRD